MRITTGDPDGDERGDSREVRIRWRDDRGRPRYGRPAPSVRRQKKTGSFRSRSGLADPCFYCGGNTAKASISTSHSGLTSAVTPTVDRAGFTGLVALLKNWPYAWFQPWESIVPPFSLSGTR